jgi:hypothetical protein
VFLGELLRGLWRKNVRDLEVLRPEVDNGGYDLALEFRGLTRHVQLKSSYRGARRADVTASVKLLGRPSACIVWIEDACIGGNSSKTYKAKWDAEKGRSSGAPRHRQEPLRFA